MKYLLVICTILLLAGCTDAQVRKADEIVGRAQAEVLRAQSAVDAAQKLADTIGIEKAKPIIDQAKETLEATQLTLKAAKDTSEAVKKAQEGGSSTIGLIYAGIMTFITGGGLMAVVKAVNTGRALTQTVRGIEIAKESLGEAEVAVLHTELSKSMDEKSKLLVKKAKV